MTSKFPSMRALPTTCNGCKGLLVRTPMFDITYRFELTFSFPRTSKASVGDACPTLTLLNMYTLPLNRVLPTLSKRSMGRVVPTPRLLKA